jgi:hypothetical protein
MFERDFPRWNVHHIGGVWVADLTEGNWAIVIGDRYSLRLRLRMAEVEDEVPFNSPITESRPYSSPGITDSNNPA